MELTVTFRHLDPNDALKNHVREKISRIEKYISNATEVHVTLSLEKRAHMSEVIVNLNRAKLTAKEVNEDNMYTAIDLVMDKIERQAKKHKDKITSHKEQHRKARQNILSSEDSEKTEHPYIVKTESVFITPITVDEAIAQMDSIDDDLLVFRNLETEKVNVLYRRKDGDFGLIESENT